jgi:hypothetical protein
MFELTALGILFVLLWIGWELHKIGGMVREFLEAFAESYLQFMKPKGN